MDRHMDEEETKRHLEKYIPAAKVRPLEMA
jgi:hypothetical protein